MHKDLDFQPGSETYFGGLRERDLSGQHHAFGTSGAQETSAPMIVNCHLGAAMQRQVRKVTMGQLHESKVLNDHCINTDIIQKSQVIKACIKLVLAHQYVNSHIDFFTEEMRASHRSGQTVIIKVGRRCSGVKPASAKINCVSTISDRCFKSVQRSSRCQ